MKKLKLIFTAFAVLGIVGSAMTMNRSVTKIYLPNATSEQCDVLAGEVNPGNCIVVTKAKLGAPGPCTITFYCPED